MPRGWLYNWVGMTRRWKQDSGTGFVEILLVVSLYALALTISNRRSKTRGSCAHEGLVTNWFHHTRQRGTKQHNISFSTDRSTVWW